MRPIVSIAGNRRPIAIFVTCLLALLGFGSIFTLGVSFGCKGPPTLVIRVDDIQDFAFREAQLFLLNESISNQIPLSLAVIPGMLGKDAEIVETIKLAINSGSEVTAHGWKHEDIAKLSLGEQRLLLSKSRDRIKEILNFDVRVMVPPMFSFNQDTLTAMHQEGYDIISTYTDFVEPGSISGVVSLPAMVEMSDFKNGAWNMKALDSVKAEIAGSIEKYGFAVIVTHPQEFIGDGKLDQDKVELYRTLLKDLKQNYSFKTLEKLKGNGYKR